MEKTFNEKREEFVTLIEETGNERLLELLPELLKKEKKGNPGIKVDSKVQIFRKALLESPEMELSQIDMYRLFGYGTGRHESMTLARQLHDRVAEGEEKVWVNDVDHEGIDPLTGETVMMTFYKVVGFGDEQPEDYIVRRKRKVKEEVEEEPSEDFADEISRGIDIS